MARYKAYDKDQGYFVQLIPAEQFAEYSIEKVIDRFVEEKLTEDLFRWKYTNDDTGQRAIHPFIKLKVILYSYARGLHTSREIEAMLKSGHIGYIFLSANTRMDHSTICGFINDFSNEIKEIFSKLLALLQELRLIDWDILMIDGTKVGSNADKELTSDAKGFSKKMDHYRELSEKIVERSMRVDEGEQTGQISSETAEQERRRIERQKKKYESVIRKIEEYENEIHEGGLDGQDKVNLTDRDSRLLKDKDAYIQGYNVQVAYSGNDVIVDIDAVSQSNDIELLESRVARVEKIKNELEIKGESKYLSDKGYCNPAQITKLMDDGINVNCAIPEALKSGWINDERYCVKEEGDEVFFSCRGGLKQKGYHDKKEKAYVFKVLKKKCGSCTHLAFCWNMKDKQTLRKFKVSNVLVDQRKTWNEYSVKMDSPETKYLYNKRIGKEHNFHDLKNNSALKYIYRRGRAKVTTVATLAGIAHNLKKFAKMMGAKEIKLNYCS